MKYNFNHKNGYIVATLICIVAILYFVTSFKGLQNTQKQLNETYYTFEKTNALISSLNTVQALSERYIITRNTDFLQSYREEIDNGLRMMDTLLPNLPKSQQNQLLELANLFQEKETLLQEFSNQNDFSNYINTVVKQLETPIYVGEERLLSARPEPLQLITVRQGDVIIHEETIERSATPSETLDNILQTINLNQQKQLRSLEDQFMALLSADQKIGQDISEILIQLHNTALNQLIEMLQQKDISFRRALITGIFVFLMVSGVVFLILLNAQKSLRQSRKMEESKRITEELMHSRHQLLLSISHDIKAPLSSILSYLEFMEKDDLPQEDIRQLSSMQNSATHIMNMLTNLLEFSRLEQRKTQIQNQTIEPIPLFLEIVDLFKPIAAGKHLKFSYQFKNFNHIQITTDPLKLRQIVTNLISNAIKYTMQGNVQLFVELLDDSARLKITVSDTGIGIPKEKINKIFDSFSQFENRPANTEGSGFGLFVVKGLTDVMNGTIQVQSTEKGTTFDIELPILKV
jgi:signal transduction histidine kinase